MEEEKKKTEEGQELKSRLRNRMKNNKIREAKLGIAFLLFLSVLLVFWLKNSSKARENGLESSTSTESEYKNTLFFEREEDQFLNPRAQIDIYNLVNEKNQDGTSIGEALYKEMMTMESRYLASITDEAGETPERVAKNLGVKHSRIMGKYNPTIHGETADHRASYPIPYFKNIHYRFLNGDGQEIDDSSNVKDILAMASVYTFKHNYLDAEHFREICMELYEKSHSYTLSISPVYFDQGCVNLTAKEEAEKEAGKSTKEILSEEKEASDGETEEVESSKAESSSGDSETATTATESGKEMQTETTTEKYKERRAIIWESSTEDSVSKEAEASEEASLASASEINKTVNNEAQGGSADGNSKNKSKSNSSDKPSPIREKNYCPGHVDLTITIQVKKFKDQNGLKEIVLDSIEKDAEWEESPFSRWKGWNEECVAAVTSLIDKDWFTEYGLSLSTVETKVPLTEEEISKYMSLLPAALSEERKELIHFALTAVGKVPYYYGGKAGKQGLEGNAFGKTIAERDYKGRNRKGLDCSGFVQWAYWTATDNALDFVSSTKELIGQGRKIKRSELVAGDLIIQPSGDSHVLMFLCWTEEGRMLAIHENGTAGTISVDEVSANYPYYRSILP